MNILEFNEKELAEQLTLIHFSIYKKITVNFKESKTFFSPPFFLLAF